MAVQLVRVGDGKVAHISIAHEGRWRPICGVASPGLHAMIINGWLGRKPKRVCGNCQIAVTRITVLASQVL